MAVYRGYLKVMMNHLKGFVETYDRFSYAGMYWNERIKSHPEQVNAWVTYALGEGPHPELPGEDDLIWIEYREHLQLRNAMQKLFVCVEKETDGATPETPED
jgi:hypothetical protein